MSKQMDVQAANWPAFAGEQSEHTVGESGHGQALTLSNFMSVEFMLLNFCADNTKPQAKTPTQVIESNGRAYAVPTLTAVHLGVILSVHHRDGTQSPWPQELPPFGWN